MRISLLTLSFAATSALSLAACKPDPAPIVMETETGEPSCLDTEAPGADIVINFDADILELQLAQCVPETIIISGGGVTNLTGLGDLREIGRLEIRYCPNLQVLTGLQDLIRVDNFIITGNQVLPSLPNFNELTTIGHLTIVGNDGLTDLGKLPASTLITLEISGNTVLTDYSGMEELTTVTGNVSLSDNAAIQNFVGLDNLSSVGGDLVIEDNPNLTSLEGLNVTSVSGDLKVLTNTMLSECDVADWVLTVDVGGATIADGNMSDLCN